MNDDLISRQAAIDAMNTRLEDIKLTWRGKVKKGEIAMYLDMRGVIETLPSAQPEIIRCKDCKHHFYHDLLKQDYCEIPNMQFGEVEPNGYCHRAERKQNDNQ